MLFAYLKGYSVVYIYDKLVCWSRSALTLPFFPGRDRRVLTTSEVQGGPLQLVRFPPGSSERPNRSCLDMSRCTAEGTDHQKPIDTAVGFWTIKHFLPSDFSAMTTRQELIHLLGTNILSVICEMWLGICS